MIYVTGVREFRSVTLIIAWGDNIEWVGTQDAIAGGELEETGR
ncbi:hypothetical protein [Richelia sinica]|nr:hypothetical protein [Richelia sinica]